MYAPEMRRPLLDMRSAPEGAEPGHGGQASRLLWSVVAADWEKLKKRKNVPLGGWVPTP